MFSRGIGRGQWHEKGQWVKCLPEKKLVFSSFFHYLPLKMKIWDKIKKLLLASDHRGTNWGGQKTDPIRAKINHTNFIST